MVDATLAPGSFSGASGAIQRSQPHLIFVWRKQHREGRLLAGNSDAMKLLPIAVAETLPRRERKSPPASPQAGTLHIDLPHAHVHIEGVDAACLRMALEMLLR